MADDDLESPVHIIMGEIQNQLKIETNEKWDCFYFAQFNSSSFEPNRPNNGNVTRCWESFHLTILRIFIRWNYASNALLLCLARASLFLLLFPIRARSFPRWFLCNWFSLLLLFFLCLPCTRRRTQHCDAIKIVPIDDISAALARVGAQESKIINYIEAKKSWTLFEIESSFALLLWTHHKLLNYRESS